jgi:hypothetical protein
MSTWHLSWRLFSLPSLAVDARVSTTISILALLATGWQGAREVVAVGLGAAGRIIKAASITTKGILRERKWRQQSSEAIVVEVPVEGGREVYRG